MFIFSQDGKDHICQNGKDVFKAMGVQNMAKSLIMTDESGQLVGAGRGGEGLMASMPLVEALRTQKPMVKAQSMPLRKSMAQAGSFDELLHQLNRLKKGM